MRHRQTTTPRRWLVALLIGVWVVEYSCATCAGEGGEHSECSADSDASSLQLTWEEFVARRSTIVEETLARGSPYTVDVGGVDFVDIVAHTRCPLLLKNTPASNWPAHSKWTDEHLADVAPTLLDVYVHPNNEFYYFNVDKEMYKLPNVMMKEKFETTDMATSEFFQRIRKDVVHSTDGNGDSTHEYVYYSGKIELLGDSVAGDIDRSPFLVAQPTHAELDEVVFVGEDYEQRIEGATATLWMGGPNVTATAHYDGAYNYYHQLQGRKRFILYPPAAHSDIHLYPMLHPSYRQAQAPFASPDTTVFPRADATRRVVLDLEPHSTLYLPPYWFHRVIALTPSVSVNVWSDALEVLLLERVFSSAIPIDDGLPNSETIATLALYMEMLGDAIDFGRVSGPYGSGSCGSCGSEGGGEARGEKCSGESGTSCAGQGSARLSGKEAVARVFELRYASVVGPTGADILAAFDPVCGPTSPFALGTQSEWETATRARLQEGIDRILPAFNAMSDPAVREILFGNFVEVLTNFALKGSVGSVAPFLDACFSQRS